MKILTKKLILFIGLIALIFFVFKIPAVQAACPTTGKCTLADICITEDVTVNVVNSYLPSGKNVFVGCSGDSGPINTIYIIKALTLMASAMLTLIVARIKINLALMIGVRAK